MRLLPIGSAVCLATALLSSGALAADPARVWDQHFTIGLQIDQLPLAPFGGINAVTFNVAPTRWASFEMGGGLFWTKYPLAFAMAHLQVPVRGVAFGTEGGFAVAPFDWTCGSYDGFSPAMTCPYDLYYPTFHVHTDLALFARVGATSTLRSTTGHSQIRFHGGGMRLLNPKNGECIPRVFTACSIPLDWWFAYFGFTAGYVFNL